MIRRYLDLILLVFLICLDAIQINYFANRYYKLFIADEFSFVINDKILQWRQKEKDEEILNLTDTIERINKKINSSVNPVYPAPNLKILKELRIQLKQDLSEQKILLQRDETPEKRRLLLSLDDFKYFSLSTSTTSGFGDITPVSSSVRKLIRHQIFISLITTGLIISLLMNRVRRILDFVRTKKMINFPV
jgi:hypothetical protein